MPTRESIRDLWASGKSQRAIAKELGINRESVAEFLKREDFNARIPVRRDAGGKLEKYKPLICRLRGCKYFCVNGS